MRRKQLLIVTSYEENCEEVISYAVDLAKVMNNCISLLLIYKRKVMETVEDIMTVVAFAPVNSYKTGGEMIKEDSEKKNESYEERLHRLVEKCQLSGVPVDFSTAATDAVAAIKNLLRQYSNIDMVLLSPSITQDHYITVRKLNRLVITTGLPFVTMAKKENFLSFVEERKRNETI